MNISANSAVTYWTPKDAKRTADTLLPPTASTLSAEGGPSLTNRGHAVASQFRFIQQNNPTVELLNVAPLNGFNAQNAIYEATKINGTHPFVERINYSARSLASQKTSLGKVYSALGNLAGSSAYMQRPGSFNIKSALSNRSEIVNANAGGGAAIGKYRVTANSLAESHQVATSDAFSPDQQLGLSGSIRINGWNIDIQTTDTLVSIRDSINYGEDANHNGKYDYAEDINGNGTLDEFRSSAVFVGRSQGNNSGYLPSFYLNEDTNGDGLINGAEDLTGNERLDGNSSQTGVSAYIWENRLVISSQEPANVELRLRDADRVMETLGILYRNETTAELSFNRLNPKYVETQMADVTVKDLLKESAEDVNYKSPVDYLSGAIEGVVIGFKRADYATLRVENDLNKVTDPVNAFVSGFNGALQVLNVSIGNGGMLDGNIRMNAISADLARGFYTPPNEPKGIHGKLRSVKDVGIYPGKSEPTAISQPALSRISTLLKDRLSLPGKGEYAFNNIAKRAGINSADNFTATVSRRELEASLQKDAGGVGDLLGYPAARLKRRIDTHIQPDYGTIRYQGDLAEYYRKNRGAANARAALKVKVMESNISSKRTGAVFSVIA